MAFDTEQFMRGLRCLLTDEVDDVLAFWLSSIDRDIADGWRCFYADIVWAKQHLPPPLINELGRRYECELLKTAFNSPPLGSDRPYDSAFLTDFYADASCREGFRDLLNLGLHAAHDAPAGHDPVGFAAFNTVPEGSDSHPFFEIQHLQHEWKIEASHRGTLTPPLMGVMQEPATPVRDAGMLLVDDIPYWRARYHSSFIPVYDPQYLHVSRKPDCILSLMAQLAQDFPYASELSTSKCLMFAGPTLAPVRWALLIEKRDGMDQFRVAPRLVLINAGLKKKVKDADILFFNPAGFFFGDASSPRALEIELLFHLPRARRFAAFYTPYVERALARQPGVTA